MNTHKIFPAGYMTHVTYALSLPVQHWHCIYLQYLATISTLTAVVPFQSPASQSRTLSRISSSTRPSVQCLRCLLKMYLFARYQCIQRVRGSWWLLRYINSLTYLQTDHLSSIQLCPELEVVRKSQYQSTNNCCRCTNSPTTTTL